MKWKGAVDLGKPRDCVGVGVGVSVISVID